MTRHEKCHAAIRAAYLQRGGTEAQWAHVAADPRKFNRAWRRLLSLARWREPTPLIDARLLPHHWRDFHR